MMLIPQINYWHDTVSKVVGFEDDEDKYYHILLENPKIVAITEEEYYRLHVSYNWWQNK